MENDIEQIKNVFRKSNKHDFWKSAFEISRVTRINPDDVSRILNNSNDFYQSYRDNITIYTTKENFRKFQSFGRRLLGAFRNRID